MGRRARGRAFVDVINTMVDETLPLTPGEWPEWGNPITDKAAFDYMLSYSPYDNVTAKAYPPMLVSARAQRPARDLLGTGEMGQRSSARRAPTTRRRCCVPTWVQATPASRAAGRAARGCRGIRVRADAARGGEVGGASDAKPVEFAREIVARKIDLQHAPACRACRSFRPVNDRRGIDPYVASFGEA